MFTGIIEEIGTVSAITRGRSSCQLKISCSKIMDDIKPGDSIAVNGVCLTASSILSAGFTADVMHETLNRSALGALKPGSHVNLERALSAGRRFGGHIVSGHIDGTGTVKKRQQDDNAVWYTIQCSPDLMRYIIEKGSIAIDGISLTVAGLTDTSFSVSIIPHTLKETILIEKKPGDIVNLENDCIGKYVEHLMNFQKKESKISMSFLAEHGF